MFKAYLVYIKLGVVALLVGGAAWVSWQLRSSSIEEEKREAVESATKQLQKDLDTERWLRGKFEALADKKLEDLLISISNIKVEHTTITNNITKEREAHKEFYSQKLPAGGYEEWMKARALVAPPVASSPQQ